MKAFYYDKFGVHHVAYDANEIEKTHAWAEVKASTKGVYSHVYYNTEGFVIADTYTEARKIYSIHAFENKTDYDYNAVFNSETNEYDISLSYRKATMEDTDQVCPNNDSNGKELKGRVIASTALHAYKLVENFVTQKKKTKASRLLES